MKRVIALLVVLLFVLPLGASAEVEADLQSMSVDELLELQEAVIAELENKGYSKSAILEIGSYVAGEEIPTGTFTIGLIDEEQEGYFNYHIYNENGELVEEDLLNRKTIKITLKENYTLLIERSPIKITTFRILWQ